MGGYQHVVRGACADFPGITFRSTWERNIARVLHLLLQQQQLLGWSYETEHWVLTTANKGNGMWIPDFTLLLPTTPTNPPLPWLTTAWDQQRGHNFGGFTVRLEVKGRLPCGGWLHTLDTSAWQVLRDRDDAASAIKLQRVRLKYPRYLIFVMGEREYGETTQAYSACIPTWEYPAARTPTSVHHPSHRARSRPLPALLAPHR